MADVVQGRLDEAAADLIVAKTHVETALPDRRHLQAAIASAKRRGRGYHFEADPVLVDAAGASRRISLLGRRTLAVSPRSPGLRRR
jgi:hypothetical protein